MNNRLKILSSKLREFGIIREAEVIQELSEAVNDDDISRMLSEHSRAERKERLNTGRSDLSEFYEHYVSPAAVSGVEYSREKINEPAGYNYRRPSKPWAAPALAPALMPALVPDPPLTPKTPLGHVTKMDVKPGVDFAGLDNDAKKLTSILAMVALEMGHPPMLVTSGFRGGRRQAEAMYDNYISRGGIKHPKKGQRYLVGLYADGPARIMAKIFRENPRREDAINKAEVYLDVNPISAHSRGVAVDFRNTSGALEVAREAKARGYFKGKVGDETRGRRPHVHVRIDSMEQDGLKYLSAAGRGAAVV